MNQAQVDSVYGMALKMIEQVRAKDAETDKAAEDAAVIKLTNDAGGAANYKVGCELNARLLTTFFDEATAEMIEKKGMGNNVGFWKGINKMAEIMVKEGRIMKGSAPTGDKAGGALQYKKMKERQAEGG